ncbi:MAG TPA: hypothetical protein VFQ39_13495 [Longimicrobium sp.]|nr:hypothetical protein [Longimicrobium sp.]
MDGAATAEGRVTWMHGEERAGPRELIGVLELRGDGSSRAVMAERNEVDGRCHILLAREAWGPKDSLSTRWWSLVLDADHKAYSVRTGSCGDPLNRADVPAVARALEEMGLLTERTMLYLADGPAAFPGREKALA